jgi:predicted TIM-barrel fold metal-dependent hydrolase
MSGRETHVQFLPCDEEALLANAERSSADRGLGEVTIVDADLHLHGLPDSGEVRRHIRHANLQRMFTNWGGEIPRPRGDTWVGGRIKYPPMEERFDRQADVHPTAVRMVASMDRLAIDYAVVSHPPLLYLAQHPMVEVETELSWAFAKWLVEEVLPGCERLRTMPYLPITDPQFSVQMIDEFADHPSVAGFTITALNYLPLHRNEYMKVFAALDERGLPLAVHTTHNWLERPFNLMPRFLGAHAVGTPFYGMVHLFNAIIAGLPERFPRIRWIWREAGQSWLTFAASRLDNEYKQRTSEAPLLTRQPSDYIREMFFATQPLECEFPSPQARTLFDYVNGGQSFIYSSGYPGPDFDTPAAIWDLEYLTEDEKRAVLAGNALRLFDFKVRDRAVA